MMIYYINIKNLMQAADRLCLPSASFEIQYRIFLSLLDPAVQTRILRYRKETDRLRSLASQLLLYHASKNNQLPDHFQKIDQKRYDRHIFKYFILKRRNAAPYPGNYDERCCKYNPAQIKPQTVWHIILPLPVPFLFPALSNNPQFSLL